MTITQNVLQGEVDFGLPIADGYVVSQITASGAPLGFVYPDPTVAVTSALAVVKNASHPNAARLFAEWAVSKEGNIAWATGSNNAPMRTDIPDTRTYLNEPWFQKKTGEVWTGFTTDKDFLSAMTADGTYFPEWNKAFGYSG